jgi:hypothetical protein
VKISKTKKGEISQIYTRKKIQKVPKNLAKKIRKNRLKKKIKGKNLRQFDSLIRRATREWTRSR